MAESTKNDAAMPKGSTGAGSSKPTAAEGLTDMAKGAIGKAGETAKTLVGEAAGAARHAANEGKTRASEALTTVSKVVENAAELVEDKVGPTYGKYARQAATSVSGFAEALQNKDIDELIEDTRDFVRKSPLVAIGAAAALGFALTRIAKIGSEADTPPGA